MIKNNPNIIRILEIEWKDYITTQELLEETGMKPLSKGVKQHRWKMIGNILRQDKRNDCNTVITWMPKGKRKKGRPKMTWRTW